jgi:cytochrome c oxidase subunit 2
MSTSPRTRTAPGTIVAGVVVIVVLLLVALAAANGTNVVQGIRDGIASLFPPHPATTQGDEIASLYNVVFFIAAAIFLVVEGLIIWTVIRYRRAPGDDELPPQTHGNNLAEVAWTVIPTLIVAFLFFISWQTLNKVDTVSASPDLRVKAVAGQFQWTFVYLAEDGVTEEFRQVLSGGPGGGLQVPVGRNVQVLLESSDVIHAFYVPRFLYKRDVVPGMINQFEFRLKDDEAGQVFTGQCAELCGAGHRAMTFDVRALSGADFDTWRQEQLDKANATPPPAPSGEPPPPGEELVVEAVPTLRFSTDSLEAPADQPFAIRFENNDANVLHDVAIQGQGGLEFNGEDVTGPAEIVYQVPALAGGSYQFLCTIHPQQMTGTLTVQ